MADGAGRQANAGCNNTEGSYTCVCNTGYERSDADNGTCVDVDECGSGAHSCDVGKVFGVGCVISLEGSEARGSLPLAR